MTAGHPDGPGLGMLQVDRLVNEAPLQQQRADEPVILATLTDASGQRTPLLIDGYALPVIVHVKIAALERPWPGAL